MATHESESSTEPKSDIGDSAISPGVRVSFWTHETPERTLDLLHAELASGGFTPTHPDATDAQTWYAPNMKRLESCLSAPHSVIVRATEKQGKTTVELAARCDPVLERWAWVFVAALPLPFLAATTLFGYHGVILAGCAPAALVALIVGFAYYPGGTFVSLVYRKALVALALNSFRTADYPLHTVDQRVDSRPFGINSSLAMVAVLSPSLILVAYAIHAAPSLGPVSAPMTPLVIIICVAALYCMFEPALKRGLDNDARHRSQTREYGAHVAVAALFTNLALLAGVHLRPVAGFILPSHATLPPSFFWLLILLFLVAALTTWRAVWQARWALDTLAGKGQFAEHAGAKRRLGVAWIHIGVIASASAIALWMGVVFLIDFKELPVVVLDSIAPIGAMLDNFRSLAPDAQRLSIGFLYLLLGAKALSCAVVFTQWRRSKRRLGHEVSVSPLLDSVVNAARKRKHLRLRFVATSLHPSGASCHLEGWIRPRWTIALGNSLLDGTRSAESTEAIVAHEIAHCVLNHQLHTRSLRILGILTVLDPVLFTAAQDHTQNEEDADLMAVELLGGDDAARKQFVTVLEESRDNVLERAAPVLGASLPAAFFEPSDADPARTERMRSLNVLAGGIEACLSYLFSTRVLYKHASFEYRIQAVKGLDANP